MKKYLLILIMLFFTLSSEAQMITGEVKYTEEIARHEVFSEGIITPSIELIQANLIDKHCIENNVALLKGQTSIKDRTLVKFSDETYGVTYKQIPLFSWIYTSSGQLISFIKRESLNYPTKTVKYKPDGSIINAGYKVSDKESYIYSIDGKMLAHWKGNICFDLNDNIIMIRKFYD